MFSIIFLSAGAFLFQDFGVFHKSFAHRFLFPPFLWLCFQICAFHTFLARRAFASQNGTAPPVGIPQRGLGAPLGAGRTAVIGSGIATHRTCVTAVNSGVLKVMRQTNRMHAGGGWFEFSELLPPVRDARDADHDSVNSVWLPSSAPVPFG